jgi:hypothetical protein
MNPAASLAPTLARDARRKSKPNHVFLQMKIAFIAAAAALLAASCCPSSAPAPSKPAYVTPAK